MTDQFDIDTTDRLARLETKMDAVLETVKSVHVKQDTCPARTAYLANKHVLTENELKRARIYGFTGWLLALTAGVLNFGDRVVAWLRS
jgi:hypothetical protein